mgnify:CR=1 FL=1
MSQNLIAHVCVAGVALLLDGVRVNFKPGETLPDALPLTVLDELVSLGAVEKRIAEPNSFVSEAAGSNEAGAAGGAIPGTHTPTASEGAGAVAEAAAAPVTEADGEVSAAPAAGKKKPA